MDNYFSDSLALMTLLISLTCSSALSSASSDDSEMRMITSVVWVVPEISMFMEIFNVHLPLPSLPCVSVTADAAVMLAGVTDMVLHNELG